MKITRRQLRNIVKEAVDVHLSPDDLDGGGCAYGDVPGASRSGLAASFAKEAEAKSAALSGATSFHDSLAAAGTEIDDEILGRIYAALLDSARVLQGSI